MNAENKIVGIGYNGMPNGCSDDLLPWSRTAERKLDTKYPYGRSDFVFHSEQCHSPGECLNVIIGQKVSPPFSLISSWEENKSY